MVVFIILGGILLGNVLLKSIKSSSNYQSNINIVIGSICISILNLILLLPLVNCSSTDFSCQADIKKYNHTFLGWLVAPITISIIMIIYFILYILEEKLKLSGTFKFISIMTFLIYIGIIIYYYIEINNEFITNYDDSNNKPDDKKENKSNNNNKKKNITQFKNEKKVKAVCNLKFN